jgi:23S rRNA A2030 N6-methylase RlmJ
VLAHCSRLVMKDKPLRYVDTHAGAGATTSARRCRLCEHEGVSRRGTRSDAPGATRWLTLARRFNGSGPRAYRARRGSRAVAASDDLFLFELTPPSTAR